MHVVLKRTVLDYCRCAYSVMICLKGYACLSWVRQGDGGPVKTLKLVRYIYLMSNKYY